MKKAHEAREVALKKYPEFRAFEEELEKERMEAEKQQALQKDAQ